MAFITKTLTLISIFALLHSSIEAQYVAPAPSFEFIEFSYISLAPDASPASTPVMAPSTIEESIVLDMSDALLGDIPLTDVTNSKMAVTEFNPQEQKQVSQMVEKSMQKVEQKIAEFNEALKKRLENPDATTQECINQCDEVYANAIEDVKKAIDSLNYGNLVKANFDISAISTNVDTCEQCFNEMIGEDPELRKFDEWIKGITSQALGSLEEISS